MTNLTEQWKKGKLPSGWYWVDYYSVDGAVMLEYIPQHNGFGYEEKELVQAVLAEVPTFDEYQKLISDQLAKNEGVEINAELEAENTKLKELLKGAREVLKMVDTYSGDYDSINGFLIVEEINQVLADNKIQEKNR